MQQGQDNAKLSLKDIDFIFKLIEEVGATS